MANGVSASLAQFETPFSDVKTSGEHVEDRFSADELISNLLQQAENPFSKTYEAAGVNALTPQHEEYVSFIAELNSAEFVESLYEMAVEMEDSWRNNISNELAMGNNYFPYVTRQAKNYLAPVMQEVDNLIDRVTEHFSGNNLADHSSAEIDMFFETMELDHSQLTPVQDQFFGKIFNKVKSVVNKGVELAKKGIAIVGKLMPINLILDKIKGLIKPLLERVLKFAIGKLPKNLQPHATTLAKKFLNLETPADNYESLQVENDLDAVQSEFDNSLAQLLFTPDPQTAEHLMMNYETAVESLEQADGFATEYGAGQSLDVARQNFINELKELKQGESAGPAIERFLPVAIMALRPVIKAGISLIGRQKVINFLADLLAKLVSKYVPENVSKPLAASIIDVGMKVIGFEVSETAQADVAYEAIANTIEDTVQHMASLDEATINDSEKLTMQLLEGFEKAAADNFPPQYIKERLRPTKQKALWIKMPRTTSVKLYKKFTHVFDVTIDPKAAAEVKIFRGLPLANFLKDKYGLDTEKSIKAKGYLYEAIPGTRLSLISRFENLPGLNSKQPKAWIQLLPLTKQAAALLFNEESLGRDLAPRHLANRFRTRTGQRFYYLQIDGVRLRIPQVNRLQHKHSNNGTRGSVTESRSADIQAVINFVKSEIRLNYYFSEEDAKTIVEKLNSNDYLGAAMSVRQSVKSLLNDLLVKNIHSKVKIVHESLPELYLENMEDAQQQFAPFDALGKAAGHQIISKLVSTLTEKLAQHAYDAVANFFKTRAAEFRNAQAQPQDGVTIQLVWKNVTGMSAIRSVISAIKGNLSIGNLSDLSLPNFPAPELIIAADKKFE